MARKTRVRNTKRSQRRKKSRRTGKKAQKGGSSRRTSSRRTPSRRTPRATSQATPQAINLSGRVIQDNNISRADGMLSVRLSPSGSVSEGRSQSAHTNRPSQTALNYYNALTKRGREIQNLIAELINLHSQESTKHEKLADEHMRDYREQSKLAKEHLDLANEYLRQNEEIELLRSKGNEPKSHIRSPKGFTEVKEKIIEIKQRNIDGLRNSRLTLGSPERRTQKQNFISAKQQELLQNLQELEQLQVDLERSIATQQ